MTTLTDVTTRPSSGLNHIDALLDRGPGWNWLTPTRTTLYYTFALTPGNPSQANEVTGSLTAFNATQQASVVSALNLLASITGITFAATADGAQADLHFAAGNITDTGVAGLTSWQNSYSLTGADITNFTADAWIYLDNNEYLGTNNAPTAGTSGYEVLLHELGHAMGLKHSFSGTVTLPAPLDNTSYTLMSYTHVGGPYSTYSPYDVAALKFLYGGDGLGGGLGYGAAGTFLIGTTAADTLQGGGGNDSFQGETGNDTIYGGAGNDVARFNGNRALYTITQVSGGYQIVGPDGTDLVIGVELAQFTDMLVPLATTAGTPPTGTLIVTGVTRQGSVLTVVSTVADADGLGPLSYRWQSETAGTWSDISGATASTFTPTEAQVGLRLRVVGSYTDGAGTAESVSGTPSDQVANLNDAPTGNVVIDGIARQGSPLVALSTLADPDGLGTLAYRWQASNNGLNWTDIPGATESSFTPGEAQVGLQLRLAVNYTDGHGSFEALTSAGTEPVINTNDPLVGNVVLSGTARQGQPLTATASLADADGLGPVGLRWQVSNDGNVWTDIPGAVTSSFTPSEPQVGKQLRVVASATDGHGTLESMASAASGVIENINDPLLGTVRLTGAVEQGQTLGIDAVLSDEDGLGPFSYEWQRSADGQQWTAITGAQGTSFTPGGADVGQLLRAVVRFTDGHGTAESKASAASAAVLGVVTGTAGNDELAGSIYADRLIGGAGNDRLSGGGGDDQLDGGSGIDVAIYGRVRSDYTIGNKGVSVTAKAGNEGGDTLSGVERVRFVDQALAFDLDGNAGLIAKYLGAVFGKGGVANATYAGIGLSLYDAGTTSPSSLMSLALTTALGAGYTPEAEVRLLFRNLTGTEASPADVAYWVGTLSGGQYTNIGLAMMAADHPLNLQNIDLTGLTNTGLAYIPVG